MHYRFYIAFWILFFIVFAAASAWSFVLASKLDGDDVTDPENKKWKTGSYVAGGIYAGFAILTIIIGVIHTKHLAAKGYIDGLSPADQAMRLNQGLGYDVKNTFVAIHNQAQRQQPKQTPIQPKQTPIQPVQPVQPTMEMTPMTSQPQPSAMQNRSPASDLTDTSSSSL